MAATDRMFSGPIPELYDRYLGPLLFEPYAADLAGRLMALDPRIILETAAGTGVLTRAMASVLPAEARIVATDLNQAMLDRAMERQSLDDRIEWQQADAQALPFEDHRFDVVACQFGAMFFPDKAAAYGEARRVLKPGGCFLFNVWDRLSDNEFPQAVTDVLTALFPENPPSFMSRFPHGYFDTDAMRADLEAAGFTTISIDAVNKIGRAASAREVAVAFCQGTPVRSEIEARGDGDLERTTQIVADELARRFGNGAIEGRLRAFVITAT